MRNFVNLDVKAKLLIAGVFMILGFMLSVQYKSVNLAKTVRQERMEDMANRLKLLEKDKENLTKELAYLREKSSKMVAHAELDRMSILAGTTEVEGKGIEIVLDDSKVPVGKASDNANLYIIHDEDLLRVINELRAAGAEALSINEQRIVTTTEIRCAGPTVSVNNVRSAAPYVVKAIGEPKTLSGAMKLRGGVADTFSVFGIQVKIKEADKVKIPAFKAGISFEHAKIVKKEAKE